jgi:hypothetical protein
MRKLLQTGGVAVLLASVLGCPSAEATPFFDNGAPDGRMAMASRPGGGEIEAADDFILNSATSITSATFTGLLTGATPVVGEVKVEIYRVFPNDSVNPPSGNVPTRVNSPSDVEFADRDTGTVTLTFSTTVLNGSFTAANSVLNGINKVPNQTTGGEGPVNGEEVFFTVNFTSPFDLPADHYFFIPQVQVAGGEFYWLSSARPNTITPFAPDLQSWIRNENLAPDWLRIGTDIVGGTSPPTFNGSFSLNAAAPVPEPSTLVLFAAGLLGLVGFGKMRLRAES